MTVSNLRRHYFWPALLIFLGVGFLGFVGWSLFRANVPGSKPIPAYLHQSKVSTDSSWTVHVSRSGRTLSVSLFASDGTVMSGYRGSLSFPDDSHREVSIPLIENPPGRYQGTLPPALQKTVSGRLYLEQSGSVLTRSVDLRQDGV